MKRFHEAGPWSLVLLIVLAALGCSRNIGGNIGHVQSYAFPKTEADWVRNGEPIEFEKELWYPMDDVEVMQDLEMSLIGEYRDVQVFVSKMDVRPYARLYTKFGNNQFRIYEKKISE